MEVEVKGVDEQGRIILPKAWREKYLKNKKVIILAKGDTIEIKPFSAVDLTEYFDKIEVDVKSDLHDWQSSQRTPRELIMPPAFVDANVSFTLS
jgi:bifunctional DNA-binding transcriptional regulator/antitoxin component of YhaV-PrlF toxin-antitoxin module